MKRFLEFGIFFCSALEVGYGKNIKNEEKQELQYFMGAELQIANLIKNSNVKENLVWKYLMVGEFKILTLAP